MSAILHKTKAACLATAVGGFALEKVVGEMFVHLPSVLLFGVAAAVFLFDDARRLIEKGCSVIPLLPRSKKPAVPWKEFTERHTTLAEAVNWWGSAAKTKFNLGLVCGQISRLIAIDADSRDAAVELYHRLPRTPLMVKTARGIHFFYRMPPGQFIRPCVKVTIMGICGDVRPDNSYVTAPHSEHETGVVYEWVFPLEEVDFGAIPCFDPAWIEVAKPHEPHSASKPIRDARAYISKLVAVSGRRGHDTTFCCACVLRDSGLSEAEALAALVDWNRTNCFDELGIPYPWSTGELLHKVRDAFRKPPQPPQPR